MTDRQPAEAFPPRGYIKEMMEGRGWNQKQLAAELGCSRSFVGDLLTGKRGISQGVARRLADVFGTSAILWLNLEDQYQLWRTRSE